MTEPAPRCPRCQAQMEFQRIDPGIRGFDNHVYECGRCYTMKTTAVSRSRLDTASAKQVAGAP